jgi:hypothetical protein
MIVRLPPTNIKARRLAVAPAAAPRIARNQISYCGFFFAAGAAGADRTVAQGSFDA